MRLFGLRFRFPAGRVPSPRLATVSIVAALAVGLSACATGGGGGGGGVTGLFGGGANQQQDYDPDYFVKAAYCPPVEVRLGAETFQVYERGGDGDASRLRYQASIARTARECTPPTTGTMSIKLGVGGRVVAGPKGGAGAVELPLRVAVVRQGDNSVLFSQLYKFKVGLDAPSFNSEFSQVFNQISFPASPSDQDMIVYVGFDSSK